MTRVLVVNAGSSSLKLRVLDAADMVTTSALQMASNVVSSLPPTVAW